MYSFGARGLIIFLNQRIQRLLSSIRFVEIQKKI